MAEEFEGDLADAEFWGADLSRARFRYVDLSGARITHARLVDVEVDAYVERFVVNGVDVTDYVNERDRWSALRRVLEPGGVADARRGWSALVDAWSDAALRVRRLPEGSADVSVDGEWSFVETLRHLVFAMDKWWSVPVLGRSYESIGLPDAGSAGSEWPGLDRAAVPALDEVAAVRAAQATRFAESLGALSDDDLARTVEIDDAGANPLQECIGTVLEEEFWHLRYADRDLAALESRR